jgi:hypothetical protein
MKWKIRALPLLLTLLTWLPLGSFPALAAEDGAYLAATNTYYLNPDTGKTDDGGTGNAAIGEGMCRSVVYKNALVELDGGKTYLTVRLLLLSNMQNVRLLTQEKPGGSYKSVKPKILAEDAGTDSADYLFEIPSLTGYISWEMYVIPMGRDVKFYMNVSDVLTAGSGDFIVSVKPKATPVQTPTQTPTQPSTQTLTQTPPAAPEPAAGVTPEPAAVAAPTPASPESAPATAVTADAEPLPEPAAVPTGASATAPEETALPAAVSTPAPAPVSAPEPIEPPPAAPATAPDVKSGSGFPLAAAIAAGAVAAVVATAAPKSLRKRK